MRIAAMCSMARKLAARFSYRVAIRRNCFNRLNKRSTRLRARYASRSKPGRRRCCAVVGITAPLSRRRKPPRDGRPEKLLSPATRRGRSRGRPRGRRTAPLSSKAGSATQSWRSPPLSAKLTGLPCPSARTWILVENPPRLRPSASQLPPSRLRRAPAACWWARTTLLSTTCKSHSGGLGLQGFEDALPDAGLAQSVKAARYRPDRPEALRQVPPGRAGAQDPENAIEDGSMFMVWAAGTGPLWRKQGREMPPLPIRQLITCHDLQMASQSQRATLCRHALAGAAARRAILFSSKHDRPKGSLRAGYNEA